LNLQILYKRYLKKYCHIPEGTVEDPILKIRDRIGKLDRNKYLQK